MAGYRSWTFTGWCGGDWERRGLVSAVIGMHLEGNISPGLLDPRVAWANCLPATPLEADLSGAVGHDMAEQRPELKRGYGGHRHVAPRVEAPWSGMLWD